MADRQINPQLDLSVLAPVILPGEAISSWLVRIADAHMVTLDELQNELGCSVAAFDRGDLASVSSLAAMANNDAATLGSRVPEDLIAHPIAPDSKPPHGWAVCEHCIAEDIYSGRPRHVRQAWAPRWRPFAINTRSLWFPTEVHGSKLSTT